MTSIHEQQSKTVLRQTATDPHSEDLRRNDFLWDANTKAAFHLASLRQDVRAAAPDHQEDDAKEDHEATEEHEEDEESNTLSKEDYENTHEQEDRPHHDAGQASNRRQVLPASVRIVHGLGHCAEVIASAADQQHSTAVVSGPERGLEVVEHDKRGAPSRYPPSRSLQVKEKHHSTTP
eukprot:CAMPEP_0114626648 /NCGR_PEP_ID=MMETSP0168-20121206/11892_1 /TAXON_ID=95228 ORGANISM="Vannella sp., Strain DIVA3 517/6/12" /NCGR_SAMPLE_ID=MMETSP0168 /ASSEMBLY_ACC=CAM_ASM_000044 /LENGTH=177 /DNA_ID=CAMNT_0001837963 /DNA_START=116 /DNA_END=649 /DNA_ORIENTATION=+